LLTYKGNDLRYNVYLKKLNKMARKDMGIDILGYKDYVNNLKEFAHINKDMHVFAAESMAIGTNPEQRQMTTVSYQPDVDMSLEGSERVEKNAQSILWTIRKLMRSGKSWISNRDRRAVRELEENMKLYMINNEQVLFDLRRLYTKHKRDSFEVEKHMDAFKELNYDMTP
jgi:hypothetical protein